MSSVDPGALDRLAEHLVRARAAVPAARLAATLGCTAAELAARLDALRALGAPLLATAHGYALALADPLDAAAIRAALPSGKVIAVALRRICRSTNEAAKALEPPALCVAEAQVAGRGRRQTAWQQDFGAGLALSLVARAPAGRLDPLAIALATAVAQCLEAAGYAGIRIKWPNDLYAREAKLAGLLVELDGAAPGQLCVGLGLNVHSAPELSGRETIALGGLPGPAPERNRLAAALAAALMDALERYDRKGFAPFVEAFAARDWLANCAVTLREGAQCIEGVARGVDASGALILDTERGRRLCRAGEVSRTSRTEAAWARA